MNKKWICLLLAAVMCGCAANSGTASSGMQNGSDSASGESADQNGSSSQDQNGSSAEKTIKGDQAFEEFTAKYFKEQCEKDYTTAHSYFENPAKAGIDISKAKITLGDPNYTEEEIKDYQDLADSLKSVDADSLNEENRAIYEQMTWETNQVLKLSDEKFKYIESVFSSTDGVQATLVDYFSEYELYSEEDIKPLLTLIQDVPNYTDKALAFTNEQSKKGTLMFPYDTVIEFCQNIVKTKDDSPITKGIDEEIDDLMLDTAKTESYKKQVHEALEKYFFPSYEKMIQGLEKVKDSVLPMQGLQKFENGSDLYTYTLQNYTGTDKTPDELYKEIGEKLDELTKEYTVMLKDKSDDIMESTQLKTDFADVDEILPFLKENYTKLFPTVDNLEYELEPLSPEQTRSSIAAYYLLPTIDNTGPGQIRYNAKDFGSDPSSLSFYTTLAHEGIPGHMYQRDYFEEHFNQDIQYTLGCLGAQEGYAEYASNKALDWLGFNQDTLRAYQLNEQYSNLLVLMMDLEINYQGMTLEEFTDTYGEGLENLYNQLCDMGGQFFSYFYTPGLYENMEANAKDKLGDKFDAVKFNAALLKYGNVKFSLIEQSVDQYIEDTLHPEKDEEKEESSKSAESAEKDEAKTEDKK